METPTNELTITERPYSLWFVGAILCGFGLVMVLQHEAPTLMGAIFTLIGGLLLVNSPITTARLDKASNLLVLHRRAVIRQHTQEIPLSDIVQIELQASHSRRSSTTYRLVFITRENAIVPFTGYYSSGQAGKMKQVEQMRLFLGLDPNLDMEDSGYPMFPPSSQTQFSPLQSGETSGIPWKLETAIYGNLQILRWVSPTSGMASGGLVLVQKPLENIELPGGLLSGITNLVTQRLLQVYGFDETVLALIESAKPLEPLDSTIAPYFSAYTTQPEASQRLLNAWVVIPLTHWVERFPIGKNQLAQNISQLVVLFHPGGTELALMNVQTPEQQETLINLGVDIVKAAGGW